MKAPAATKNICTASDLSNTSSRDSTYTPLIENIDSVSPSVARMLPQNAALQWLQYLKSWLMMTPETPEQADILHTILADGRKLRLAAQEVKEESMEQETRRNAPPRPTSWWAIAGLTLTATLGSVVGYRYWSRSNGAPDAPNAQAEPLNPPPVAEAVVDYRRRPVTTTAPPKIAPPTSIKTTAVPITESCYDTIFIPGSFGLDAFKKFKIPCPKKNKATVAPTPFIPPDTDEVTAVKMFNTDCLKPRNDMHVADWLRAIGKSAKSPFSSLARESQIIHYYNTLGIGCPPPEAVHHLQKIMRPIDVISSTVLTLIPGMQPLAVAQFIVGPGLELIADHLQGKKMDVEKLDNVSIQMISMVRASLPTLSAKERAALHREPNAQHESYNYGKGIFKKRFIFHNNIPHLKIDDQQFALHVQPDGIPYIKDVDGQIRFIRYNQDVEHWEYSDPKDEQLYTIENLENASTYSQPLSPLPEGGSMDADGQGIVTLSAPGKDDIKGVLVAGNFIPVKLSYIGKKLTVATRPSLFPTQRLLRKSPWGWVFDPPSSKMGNYLKILLATKDEGIIYTEDNPLSAINQEIGLSVNKQKQHFIKKDYKYFRVKTHKHKKDISLTFSLPGYSYAKIDPGNRLFKLQQTDEMIFALRNEKVPNPKGSKPFYIESRALAYLKRNAKRSFATPTRELFQGIYADADGNPFLMINRNKFSVNRYENGSIHIAKKNSNNSTTDILLWSDGNTYIRVRNENKKVSYNYSRYRSCRHPRSPAQGSSCLPLVIENELNEQLAQHIREETVNNANPNPENLVEVKLFNTPVLYRDRITAKHYFPYNDAYFEAALIDEHDKNNPLGLAEIKIFAEGNVFKRRKLIDTIVAEKKHHSIQIKKMKTFISEKANINNNIAEVYTANRPYRQLPDIAAVEDLVNEAQAADGRFVDLPVKSEVSVEKNISPGEHQQKIIDSLFPSRISTSKKHLFRKYSFRTDSKVLHEDEYRLAKHIRQDIKLLTNEIIPSTNSALVNDHPYWPAISFYLTKVMKNPSFTFQSEVSFSFGRRLQKILKIIKEENITLVSASPADLDPRIDYKVDSLLTAEEKTAGRAVYVSPEDGRIYINANKVDQKDAMQLITAVLQETFRAKGKLKDFYKIPIDENGQLPVMDAINDMTDKIKSESFSTEQTETLNELSNKYLKTVSPWHRNKNNNLFKKGSLAYMVKNDSGFRAHILLHIPDFLTEFTEDIYYRLARIHPEDESPLINNWMAKYAEIHRDIADRTIVMKIQPQRTDLPPQSVTRTIDKIEGIDGESFLYLAERHPEIADAIAHPLQKCEAIAIPVADFMKNVAFKNIRYRGLALFLHGGDAAPTNHFAVVGEKGGVDYVFDLTAHQFSSIYPELSGPLILPEKVWAQKYANLKGRRLIKYGDYEHFSDARRIFGPDSKYLSYGPGCKLPGAFVMKRPDWYFPDDVT